MLLDILVHSEGPRLRDHLSHGELELDDIHHSLCHHVLCICLAFTVLFRNDLETLSNLQEMYHNLQLKNCNKSRESCVETKECDQQASKQEQNKANQSCTGGAEKSVLDKADCSKISAESISNTENPLVQICKIVQNYQSIYHPLTVLKREIYSASQLLEKLKEVSFPDEFHVHEESDILFLPSGSSSQEYETLHKALESLNGKKAFPIDLVAICYKSTEFSTEMLHMCDYLLLKTLYRPRRELEVVALLHSIVEHCSAMVTQVR